MVESLSQHLERVFGNFTGFSEADLSDPNSISLTGDSLLMGACRNNFPETISLLLRNGAKVNYSDDLGYTALHVAIGSCSYETILSLIDAGADKIAETVFGVTPKKLAQLKNVEREILNLL